MKKINTVIAIFLMITTIVAGCGKASNEVDNSKPEIRQEAEKDQLPQQLKSPPNMGVKVKDKEVKTEVYDDYIWLTRQSKIIDPTTTKFGVVITPLEDFVLVPEPDSEDYVKSFTENGKIGFKDKEGHVLIEPFYDFVHFFNRGTAGVREDLEDGKYKWSTINTRGHLFDYEGIYGFFYGVSPAKKGDKYGYINFDGQLLTPIVFDEVYPAYRDELYCANVKLGDKYLFLDLEEGMVYEYLAYDDEEADEYSLTIDLELNNIVIVNNRVVVNGKTDDTGRTFPTILLDGLEFQVYSEGEVLGSGMGNLDQGDYEGDLFCYLDNMFMGDSYYATIGIDPKDKPVYQVLDNKDKYMNTVQQFLNDNNISKAPTTISRVIRADFLGDGTTSVVIIAQDSYQREDGNVPELYDWSEDQFKKEETGLYDVILFVQDESKLEDYCVLDSGIYQYSTNLGYPKIVVEYVVDVDSDPGIELIISNLYYEYNDYSVIDIVSG